MVAAKDVLQVVRVRFVILLQVEAFQELCFCYWWEQVYWCARSAREVDLWPQMVLYCLINLVRQVEETVRKGDKLTLDVLIFADDPVQTCLHDCSHVGMHHEEDVVSYVRFLSVSP